MEHFSPTDALSAPLAEYFFIAGIESSRVAEQSNTDNSTSAWAQTPELGAEDRTLGEGAGLRPTSTSTISSARRKSRPPYSVREDESGRTGLPAQLSPLIKRNSTIIWEDRPDMSSARSDNHFDEEFANALHKFAADRDSFLETIHVNAQNTAVQPHPSTRLSTSATSHRREKSLGSLRRRLSVLTRSSTNRRASNRWSKRVSGYNSFVPTPQRFRQDIETHPLRRTHEPVLLDRYPRPDMVDECKKRKPFPEYVPMFVFPNDVNVMYSEEKPKSRWHSWTMTSGDGSKLYGTCIIVWMPLRADAAEKLEEQMQVWKDKMMTQEEREMARDLSERLTAQRSILSTLLAKLPSLQPDTEEREALEEEISTVEERIALMADVLRPVRHGAKVDGLDNETGFWIPRAYGLLGRSANLVSFHKEWLRAIAVPMENGSVLQIPASSPRVGLWQPLEQYVVNLLLEAPCPHDSVTQVEVAIRELRLYARYEAANEIPGSRTTDLWPLFRILDVADVVVLFEYVLMESRIIMVSSHTSLLYLVSTAITTLLWPLQYSGVFIPVLPARLLETLEAPCPYICGVERSSEPLQPPQGDYVLVDLDEGTIDATSAPVHMPRQIRRKLIAILQQAAPHRYRYGVGRGAPAYAKSIAYPSNAFTSENASIFNSRTSSMGLARLANINSASFGADVSNSGENARPVFNAFLQAGREDDGVGRRTSFAPSSVRTISTPSLADSACFEPAQVMRADTAQNYQSTLRDRRLASLGASFRRNSSVSILPSATGRFGSIVDRSKPGIATTGRLKTSHISSPSIASVTPGSGFASSQYAPSEYAQSTVASTVMPNMVAQHVESSETTIWAEGHCLQLQPGYTEACSVCDEAAEHGLYKCKGCGVVAHAGCSEQICIVCDEAFHAEQIFVAFARCFASLFHTYRRSLTPAGHKSPDGLFKFDFESFTRSVPREHAEYLTGLRETQAFNEFISDREIKSATDPNIRLFDEIILAKKNRRRTTIFSKHSTPFLADTSDHIWRTASASALPTRTPAAHAMGRTPAKLDRSLMREPRALQGAPQLNKAKPKRKQIASMISLGIRSKSSPADIAIASADKENVSPTAEQDM